MNVQLVASTSASTSQSYVQVPQFQLMTVAPSQPLNVETKTTNGKRSNRNNKNNVEMASQSPQQQHIQLVTMDPSAMIDSCNGQYIIQMQPNQMGGQFQMVSNGSMAPMQLVNLSEGTAFLPISQTATFNGHSNQPTILQTSDGQQIQFVISNEAVYNQESNEVTVVSTNSTTEDASQKQNDDSPCYVNPKQYARIFQRRGARAKLEMEGRISKQRRTYLHESRHKHALKRVRGIGGKFDSNMNGEDELSPCSSPTSSLGKPNNQSFESPQHAIDIKPPPQKRFAPQKGSKNN